MKLLFTPMHLCKKTIVKRLWLDSFGLGFPCIPTHNFNLSLFAGKKIEQGERRRDHQQDTLTRLPTTASPPPPHLLPAKVISMSCCSIMSLWAPIKEHSPCVYRNISFMHSPCYSFDIDATRPINFTPSIRWRDRCTK